jgi:hypothetical protein
VDGPDEMNRRKGHNYLTFFWGLQAKRVLPAAEGKDANVWNALRINCLSTTGTPRRSRKLRLT